MTSQERGIYLQSKWRSSLTEMKPTVTVLKGTVNPKLGMQLFSTQAMLTGKLHMLSEPSCFDKSVSLHLHSEESRSYGSILHTWNHFMFYFWLFLLFFSQFPVLLRYVGEVEYYCEALEMFFGPVNFSYISPSEGEATSMQ